MALINFHTPKTATPYPVNAIATLPAHSSGYAAITLTVTSTAAIPRADLFYQEFDIANATATASAFHATYSLAIVPQLYGSDTVTVNVDYSFHH